MSPATPQRPRTRRLAESLLALLLGFGLSAAALLALLLRDPSWFVQDDNLVQFLPVLAGACNAALQTGELPTYNPFTLLGHPLWENPAYGLGYPALWASCAGAGLVQGNPLALLDWFVLGHLLLAWLAMFGLLRKGGSPWLAALGASIWVLSGFALIGGRSQFYFAVVMLWLPLLMARMLRLAAPGAPWPGLPGILGTGILLGLFLAHGNPQSVLYVALAMVLVLPVLVLSRRIGLLRLAAHWLPAALIGLGLAWPILALGLSLAEGVERSRIVASLSAENLFVNSYQLEGGADRRYFLPLMSLLLPLLLGLSLAALPRILGLWWLRGSWRRLPPQLGTLLPAPALAALTGLGVMYVLLLGQSTPLWSALHALPWLDLLSRSTKFVPYVAFFAVWAGILLLQARLQRLSRRLRRGALLALWALALAHGAAHWLSADQALYRYGARPPARLGLPEVWAPLLPAEGGRILALAEPRSRDPAWALAGPHQWPAFWGVPAAGGYDPLVTGDPRRAQLLALADHDLRAFARIWSVRLALEHAEGVPVEPDVPGCPECRVTGTRAAWERIRPGLQPGPSAADGRVRAWILPEPDPMAFAADGRALPLTLTWTGAWLALPGDRAESVTVALAWDPGLRAEDATGAPIPLKREAEGRLLLVTAQAAPGQAKILWQPPFRRHESLAAAFLCLGLGLAALTRAIRPRSRKASA